MPYISIKKSELFIGSKKGYQDVEGQSVSMFIKGLRI
jgi:hypothetical protein